MPVGQAQTKMTVSHPMPQAFSMGTLDPHMNVNGREAVVQVSGSLQWTAAALPDRAVLATVKEEESEHPD